MTREGLKLLRAASEGNVAQIIALLDAGFDINEPNEKGMTPLHFAADVGSIEAVNALVERQADVNARTSVGLTPLMLSARGGHPGIVGLLLKAGADVSVRVEQVLEAFSDAGKEALSLATDAEVVKLLQAARV